MVIRACILLLLTSSAFGNEAAETIRTALNACDQAVDRERRDPIGAAELYREAASGLQQLRDEGVTNAALFFNLGNIHFRLGQTGQAIAYYRRASSFEPGNRSIQANLSYARQRVEPQIQPGDEEELWQRILFWQYGTTRNTRLWATALLGIVGWGALACWLHFRKQALLGLGMAGVALALLSASGLGWELRQQALRPGGVVVNDPSVLRLGRGEGYDAALSQPLGPGVELQIQQQRGDWYEVRLVDGTSGWLPAASVQRIDAL